MQLYSCLTCIQYIAYCDSIKFCPVEKEGNEPCLYLLSDQIQGPIHYVVDLRDIYLIFYSEY